MKREKKPLLNQCLVRQFCTTAMFRVTHLPKADVPRAITFPRCAVHAKPSPPPNAPSFSTALSRKIVSCSSAVATASAEGVDSAFPLRTRGSWYKILLNRTYLHTGARASMAGRGEGPAGARAPEASIVLLRGEAPRRGKRGGQRETGAGTAYYS